MFFSLELREGSGEDREKGLWMSRQWRHRVQAFTVYRREMEETKVPCPLDSGHLMVLVLTSPQNETNHYLLQASVSSAITWGWEGTV